jgi:hypothetical protein
MHSLTINFKRLLIAAFIGLFCLPNANAEIPKKVKVSSDDTTGGYLNGKLVAGTGISFTENNGGGDETLTIANTIGLANGAPANLYLEGSTADNFEQILGSDDPTADRTFNFPDDDIAANDVLVGDGAGSLAYLGLSSTQILIGDGAGAPTAAALSGDVTMTNAGVVSIAANAAALGTDTTGNYVATIADAGSTTVTVSGSGSETAAVTLDVIDVHCTGCLSATELAADSVSASELDGSGVESELEGLMDLQDLQGAVTDAQVPNTITVDSASSVEGVDMGTLTNGKVCIYDGPNTELDCTADTSGVGDMLKLTYDTDANSKVDATDQIGTLTNLKWCSSNGTTISCTENAPAAGDNITVDTVAVTDPDFASTGDIDFVNTSNTITANINTGAIVNGDVNASAAIDFSKLATLTSGNILVGSAGNVATSVAMSGDVAIIASGATTIQANSVALTTDTTGNYAAGDAEAGAALTGDSATSFFSAGTIEDARLPSSMADKTITGSLIIPTGTGPTVDAAGKIAEDTTQTQLLFGSTPNVLSPVHSASVTVSDVVAADDNVLFFVADRDITVTGVACRYEGTGSTVATFTLENAKAGTGMTITGTNPTCVTGNNNAAFAAITANNAIVKGDGIRFDTTNTTNPLTDDYTITIQYTEDRK